MRELPFEILKIDWNESSNIWIIRLRRRADGKLCQAQFGENAWRAVRAHPMGQLLLHMWFGRAGVVPEDQPAA